MFKSYLKTAWRNLFRNKIHTLIITGGLVIGFTIGIFVLLAVYFQFSFDAFHANKKDLYKAYVVLHKKEGDVTNTAFGYPAAITFKAEAPAIARTSRFLHGGNKVVYNEKQLDIPVTFADPDFFSMFTFPVVRGNKTNPLQDLAEVVLTENTAKKIFGSEDPIGKIIKLAVGDQLQAMTVTAIVKNIPNNSTIKFDVLARIENRSDYATAKNNWDYHSHPVYVQLKQGASIQQAEAQLRAINQRYLAEWTDNLKKNGARPDKQGDVFATRLMPMNDIHFSPAMGGTNIAEVYTVLAVGLLIILIGCFNFVNINLATAFTRSREIGVRKCLGAARSKLFLQLWIESFLICFLAFAISLALVNILIHSLQDIVSLNTDMMLILGSPSFLILTVALLLFVSLIAGGYPSWVMAKFDTVETLKGKLSLKRKSFLRDSLIVTQFVIACIMISCTAVIYWQFRHLQQADLGFDKDYIVSVPLGDGSKGRETIEKLRSRLHSDPNIVSITGSSINLGKGLDSRTVNTSIGFEYKGKSVSTNIANVDYDYLKTLGIKVIEGRDFDQSFGSDTADNVLLSESAARQFHEKEIAGKNVGEEGGRAWHVIGVFPDFHLYSIRKEQGPLTLMMNKSASIDYCFIKLAPQNLTAGMEAVKREMNLLEPGREFRGSFVNDNINKWYEQEKMMSLMFSVAALITIVLSCTGLLAMVLLITQQRTKEIGIRKVLGAGVRNISILLSLQFLKLVFIAVLIAIPAAWMLMNNWLQSFAYRMELHWWMFALVALVAFMIALMTISSNTIRVAMQNPVKSLRTE